MSNDNIKDINELRKEKEEREKKKNMNKDEKKDVNQEEVTEETAEEVKDSVEDSKPEEKEEEVCPTGGYTYEVKAGDTLAKIAASYQTQVPGITWQQIARFNNLYAPYTLNIGQILRIPCVAGKG